MRLCDRCRVSGCCLDYLGEACKRARERKCSDVVYTNADHIRDMSDMVSRTNAGKNRKYEVYSDPYYGMEETT